MEGITKGIMQCTGAEHWSCTFLLCVCEQANLPSVSDDFVHGVLMLSLVYALPN